MVEGVVLQLHLAILVYEFKLEIKKATHFWVAFSDRTNFKIILLIDLKLEQL